SALTDTDGSETLSVTIAGVPAGATLSAGIDHGDGTWTLTPGDLAGLTITPPAGSDANFQLTVTATTTEGANGSTVDVTDTIDVTVVADADAPTLTVFDASGDEDTPIALNIAAALTDTDGSETLSVTIAGVPAGATLSAGVDHGDGTWTLTPGDLAGLTITPPANSDVDFQLTVTATATEAANGDVATTSGIINVGVDAVLDGITLVANDVSGAEDAWIPLDLAATLADTDGSESVTVVISGMPDGARLSHGVDRGDGRWLVDAADLDGLRFRGAPDFNGTVDLAIHTTVTEAETGAERTRQREFTVDVAAVNDAPVASATSDTTEQDTALRTVNVLGSASDVDGDRLRVASFEQPEHGTVRSNGDGTFTYTPHPDFVGTDSFEYTISDGAGGTVTAVMTIEVERGADLTTPEGPVERPDLRHGGPGPIDWSDAVDGLSVLDATDVDGVMNVEMPTIDVDYASGGGAPDLSAGGTVDDLLFGAEPFELDSELVPSSEQYEPAFEEVPVESLIDYDLELVDTGRDGGTPEDDAASDHDRVLAELDRMSEWAAEPELAEQFRRSGFLPALWGLIRSMAGMRREESDDDRATTRTDQRR
ncbi:MAG: cadherin-like domain-containing protein, partial [Phycisphaerales bacterium]|nr:cadherin-like domain-containing protein [Phycisphaerales bacterium]